MNFRSLLNQNAGLSTIIVIAVLTLAVFVIYRTAMSQAEPQPPMVFYSTDEGKTFFAADMKNIPPWEHEGREAVKAYVFTCGDDSEPFVGYLEKYVAEAKQRLEQAILDPDRDVSDVMENFTGRETLVKAPGDQRWLSITQPEATSIRRVECPDKQSAAPVIPRE